MTTKNTLSQVFRQVETVQLAPDALVFINGSNLLTDPLGNTIDIRQDITEINTSLDIDSAPGTAGFTIAYPDHQGGRYTTLASGVSKYSNLKLMSEIEIYFRGRFLKEKNGEKKYPYYRAFWGVITAITESYNDGMHTISVSCADILRWWQITNATINPSILATGESLPSYLVKLGIEKEDIQSFLKGNVIKFKGRSLSITGNNFSGLTIPEILKELSEISLLQLVPIDDYLSYSNTNVTSKDKDISQMMKYWVQRLNDIGMRLKIYALTINVRNRPDIDIKKLLTYAQGTDNKQIQAEKNDQKKSFINEYSGSPPEVYQSVPRTPAITNSDMKSQLEIANEIKEALHYEFFMDVNGEIVFKLPFYNLDVRENINSIIHDLDIINWNFIQSESEVVTRVDVSGTETDVIDYTKLTNSVSRDPYLSLQFGERLIQRSMPWLHTIQQCSFWGKSELARQNALIRQGSVTILGRPELRLGYPVFIPSRDAFYYIKGIENRFSFGGTFTTTLTLVAERAKKSEKNSVFRNVGEIKDEQVTIIGDSISEPNELNNFVKQVSMPSICTPRAKEHVAIVEPDFAINLDNIKEKFGTWEKFTDIIVPNDDGKFQVTDYEGFEVVGQVGDVPYITYGYGLKYDSKGIVVEDPEIVKQSKSTTIRDMKPQDMQLTVDANNVMYTLDSETGNMVLFGDNVDAAKNAQNAAPPEETGKDR